MSLLNLRPNRAMEHGKARFDASIAVSESEQPMNEIPPARLRRRHKTILKSSFAICPTCSTEQPTRIFRCGASEPNRLMRNIAQETPLNDPISLALIVVILACTPPLVLLLPRDPLARRWRARRHIRRLRRGHR